LISSGLVAKAASSVRSMYLESSFLGSRTAPWGVAFDTQDGQALPPITSRSFRGRRTPLNFLTSRVGFLRTHALRVPQQTKRRIRFGTTLYILVVGADRRQQDRHAWQAIGRQNALP
jgi:hypothetical protein